MLINNQALRCVRGIRRFLKIISVRSTAPSSRVQHAWFWLWPIDSVRNGSRGDRAWSVRVRKYKPRRRTGRRDAPGRSRPEGAGRHRRDEGAIQAAGDRFRFPKENPYTPEKFSLGKKLYFDTRLSVTLGAVLRKLSQPGLRLGRRPGGRRRSRHGESSAATRRPSSTPHGARSSCGTAGLPRSRSRRSVRSSLPAK